MVQKREMIFDGNEKQVFATDNPELVIFHFKDVAIWEGEPRICEVGEGNLDWPAIIQACQETNVRWYSVEQDNEWPDRDIFESIKISYDNLRALGVR